jgi:hypothetical protein
MPNRYFYDFEFIEDGVTIEPISVGIVAEDGREYYAVSADFSMQHLKSSPWLIANVLPHLPLDGRGALDRYLAAEGLPPTDLLARVELDHTHRDVKPRQQIADEVREFILTPPSGDSPPRELWGDYCAYDHVALAQLYGRMVDLPDGFPMFTRDIQDYAAHLGVEHEFLPQIGGGDAHNALADAYNIRARWRFLRQVERTRAADPK